MGSAVETKRAEFRRYLERSGVVEALTRALIALYSVQDKPEDPVAFVKNNLVENEPDPGGLLDQLEGAMHRVRELEQELEKLKIAAGLPRDADVPFSQERELAPESEISEPVEDVPPVEEEIPTEEEESEAPPAEPETAPAEEPETLPEEQEKLSEKSPDEPEIIPEEPEKSPTETDVSPPESFVPPTERESIPAEETSSDPGKKIMEVKIVVEETEDDEANSQNDYVDAPTELQPLGTVSEAPEEEDEPEALEVNVHIETKEESQNGKSEESSQESTVETSEESAQNQAPDGKRKKDKKKK